MTTYNSDVILKLYAYKVFKFLFNMNYDIIIIIL